MKSRILAVIVIFFQLCGYSQPSSTDTSDYIYGDNTYNYIIAAYKGNADEVKRLLSLGADINESVQDGMTALMYAAEKNYMGIAKILIERGAEVNIYNDYGESPLIIAVKNNNIEIAELLILNGAGIDRTDSEEVTPLMHAIANGNYVITDMLLYYGANVNIKDEKGNDALIISSFLGFTDIDSLLLDYGAYINSTENTGLTPLHVAVQNGFIDVVKFLVDNGADINALNKYGYSPLAIAVELNDIEMTEFLIKNGANANHRITMSMSILDLAKSNKNDSIKNILRKNKAHSVLLPAFEKVETGINQEFNADDYLLGFSLGLSDKKYNIDLYADYKFRPFATRVLEQTGENIYFQYWEKRAIYSLVLDKKLKLFSAPGYSSVGLFAGMKGAYTFGSYRGVKDKPAPLYTLSPRIGLYYSNNWFRSKLSYEYKDLNLYEFQKGWIGISVSFLINRKQNVYRQKTIEWY